MTGNVCDNLLLLYKDLTKYAGYFKRSVMIVFSMHVFLQFNDICIYWCDRLHKWSLWPWMCDRLPLPGTMWCHIRCVSRQLRARLAWWRLPTRCVQVLGQKCEWNTIIVMSHAHHDVSNHERQHQSSVSLGLLCVRNPSVTGRFPSQSFSKVFPCHDVIMRSALPHNAAMLSRLYQCCFG